MIPLAVTTEQFLGGAFAGFGVLCLLGCVAAGFIRHKFNDDNDDL